METTKKLRYLGRLLNLYECKLAKRWDKVKVKQETVIAFTITRTTKNKKRHPLYEKELPIFELDNVIEKYKEKTREILKKLNDEKIRKQSDLLGELDKSQSRVLVV